MNGYEQALANPESALSKFIAQREKVVNPSRAFIEDALASYERLGGSEFLGKTQRALIMSRLRSALAVLEGAE